MNLVEKLDFSIFKRLLFTAFQPKPLPHAEQLGRDLGLTWTSNQDLVDKMRTKSESTFASSTPIGLQVPRGALPFEFGPVKEPANSLEPTFLSKDPETIYRTGDFTPIPLMIGANSVRK